MTTLIDFLADEDETVWERAIRQVIAIGKPAIPTLIAALKSESEQVRMLCAELLGRIGDDRAIVPLMETLSDPSFEVREAARTSLKKRIRIFMYNLT